MSRKRDVWSRRELLQAAGTTGIGLWCGLSEAASADQKAAPRPDVIQEPPRQTPVMAECEVCVIGGSSTGVFAAVAAARLGARVVLVENLAYFGGVATASLVNIWHSAFDTEGKRRIIGGLTWEVVERLKKRGAAIVYPPGPSRHVVLNSAELAIELDQLVLESKVRPLLHTRFVAPVVQEGRVVAAVVEDKTGRRAIRAKYFIDASGDGDLVARVPLGTYRDTDLQPPTTCAILVGLDEVAKRNRGFNLERAVYDPQYPEALKNGFLWSAEVPGVPGARMVAGTRVHGADCSDADQLTRAELEGRRQVRAMCDLLRRHFPGGDAVHPVTLPARIGIRQSRQAQCLYTLTERDVLTGKRFADAIANGSYRVDVHFPDRPGLVFRYLDGTERIVAPGEPAKVGRWREKTAEDPTFYQVPFRSLVPKGSQNVLVAGRLVDADRGAFGAVRVMVNCNQMGQAAGAAAYLALRERIGVAQVNPEKLRATLSEQGAIII